MTVSPTRSEWRSGNPPGPAGAGARAGNGAAHGLPTLERYRSRTRHDRVTWGTHCANCLASCTYRVFASDGGVVWQEQAGVYPPIEPGVPDRNPMGCQKGAAWHVQLGSGDRLLHPMLRDGPRGSGRWRQATWDEALGAVADAVLDAIAESGPSSVLVDESAEGGIAGIAAHLRFAAMLGATSLDGIATVNDFPAGNYITFGHIAGGASADDTFHAQTVLIWHANPAYSRIAYFHYLTEARYHGAEVVLVAPDFSPSAPHCDLFVPVRPGADAALALAMCNVIVTEGLVDRKFVAEQTDLSLLVRTDNRRLLRASDLVDGGDDATFHHWDPEHGLVEAPQDTLKLGYEPSLEGEHEVVCFDGARVTVVPAHALLAARLASCTPEAAVETCGAHPETIRRLARRVATTRTKILEGFDSAKHYHGDLIERSMNLLLALTGNWGAQGRGLDNYCVFPFDGTFVAEMKQGTGLEAAQAVIDMAKLLFGDPDANGAGNGTAPPALPRPGIWDFMTMSATGATTTPAFFFWLDHCGYAPLWNREGWGASPRPLAEYVTEARPSFAPFIRPGPDVTPRVLIEPGANALRRTRGGRRMLLEHLWPKLRLVVSIDQRINSGAMHADVLLPAAYDPERVNLQYPITHSMELAFADKAVEPAGEARTDWWIFTSLADTIAARAIDRGMGEFSVGRPVARPLAELGDAMHRGGRHRREEAMLDELVRDSALAGIFADGTSLASLRETGFAQVQSNGAFPLGRFLGSRLSEHSTFSAFRWNVEHGMAYVTTTGRATFYVDHPWFLEAGEELPCHKDPPATGGDHPLVLTGGHPRWSIHACNATNPVIMETTRGRPCIVLNPRDAAARGISDGDAVEVFNDLGRFRVQARVAPGPRPGQVILYAAWEPYGFESWDDGTLVEAGMVKWLHLATGWGHLRFFPAEWQPVPFDRLTRVDARRVGR